MTILLLVIKHSANTFLSQSQHYLIRLSSRFSSQTRYNGFYRLNLAEWFNRNFKLRVRETLKTAPKVLKVCNITWLRGFQSDRQSRSTLAVRASPLAQNPVLPICFYTAQFRDFLARLALIQCLHWSVDSVFVLLQLIRIILKLFIIFVYILYKRSYFVNTNV